MSRNTRNCTVANAYIRYCTPTTVGTRTTSEEVRIQYLLLVLYEYSSRLVRYDIVDIHHTPPGHPHTDGVFRLALESNSPTTLPPCSHDSKRLQILSVISGQAYVCVYCKHSGCSNIEQRPRQRRTALTTSALRAGSDDERQTEPADSSKGACTAFRRRESISS